MPRLESGLAPDSNPGMTEMPTLNEIRTTFLDYFRRNGHEVVASSPLVPRNDPTLMFTNSGMVQFKNLFTGAERRDYTRAATSQRCVRAGGKHNDLDNVGHTARHHTFFEMLGNFSFGDYFKEQAIPYAWELLTKEFEIDASKLLVTVYHTDEEAVEIWGKHVGLPDERIIRIASDDNFWSMGPTGPCGPCTEIFYDHGPDIPGGPPGSPEEDGDRFIEIWNLVFMQYERFEDGTQRELEMQSIDTGMGLERVGALLQGRHDNYDTDLMRSLIEASAAATGHEPDGPGNLHHRVIADHLRSTSFLIADGVAPSNEGRGYVLRRIMRRAMRHACLLGVEEPLMHRLVPTLVAQMGQAFPELPEAQPLIEETLKLEETRFGKTLDRGLKLLDDEIEKLPDGADLPGGTAFKLYDTYGFPLDLTQDVLRERGRVADVDGFEAEMAKQRERARAAWSGAGGEADAAVWFDVAEEFGATDFLGYDTETAEGQVVAIIRDGERVKSAQSGESVLLVLNQTPFYAESGGQVGDTGLLTGTDGAARITDARKQAGVFIHAAEVTEGAISLDDAAKLEVAGCRRTAIRANHSATHLLHEALRGVLGEHVAQRGSLNDPDRLRFDFSHGDALSAEEMNRIEAEVNAHVRQNAPVETRVMALDHAREIGAQALFGEKYGEEVRAVSMGVREESGKGLDGQAYSIELCGGTHVRRTGDIGAFKIVSQGSSAAGVRRIEAVTGAAAVAEIQRCFETVEGLAQAMNVSAAQLPERLGRLQDERKELAAEVSKLRREAALGGAADGESGATQIGGVAFVGMSLSGVPARDLPSLIDEHKTRLESGVVVLVSEVAGKVAVAAGVTADLVERVSAVDLVRAAVAPLGGKGGGGRPDLAQGGGSDPAGVQAAIDAAGQVLKR